MAFLSSWDPGELWKPVLDRNMKTSKQKPPSPKRFSAKDNNPMTVQ